MHGSFFILRGQRLFQAVHLSQLLTLDLLRLNPCALLCVVKDCLKGPRTPKDALSSRRCWEALLVVSCDYFRDDFFRSAVSRCRLGGEPRDAAGPPLRARLPAQHLLRGRRRGLQGKTACAFSSLPRFKTVRLYSHTILQGRFRAVPGLSLMPSVYHLWGYVSTQACQKERLNDRTSAGLCPFELALLHSMVFRYHKPQTAA